LLTISGIEKIQGKISVPGDKSISHRAVMLLSISRGRGEIKGFLPGGDCLGTIRCFQQLGVAIEDLGTTIIVHGKGLRGLRKPLSELDAGNSGTTIRLISGILAGQHFTSIITGDGSIKKRPMDRIAIPLRMMGAVIQGKDGSDLAPLVIQGQNLKGIDYTLPVPSAQVKSSVLLAGLYASGETTVREIISARNHTELMLESLGAKIKVEDGRITVASSELEARDITVPGDISSAAFFMAAAAALPGSHLVIEQVGLNPSRIGIIDVLKAMGAQIELENMVLQGGEIRGDVVVRGKRLHGTVITREMIPRVVDEIPILAVIAGQAEGITTISGAEELRIKESDRISALVTELGTLGIRIRELPDGLEIEGPNRVCGAEVESCGDHRMAMALAIAGLFSQNPVKIKGRSCIRVSFPGFEQMLKKIAK
jgi:3-phosphoshikimate 1-carboxyvinyltransferase